MKQVEHTVKLNILESDDIKTKLDFIGYYSMSFIRKHNGIIFENDLSKWTNEELKKLNIEDKYRYKYIDNSVIVHNREPKEDSSLNQIMETSYLLIRVILELKE